MKPERNRVVTLLTAVIVFAGCGADSSTSLSCDKLLKTDFTKANWAYRRTYEPEGASQEIRSFETTVQIHVTEAFIIAERRTIPPRFFNLRG